MLTAGNVNDTTMLPATLEQIRVPTGGRARTRPERVLADKGYPSKANRAWLRQRGIARRSDKTARNYHAATLHRLNTSLSNTA